MINFKSIIANTQKFFKMKGQVEPKWQDVLIKKLTIEPFDTADAVSIVAEILGSPKKNSTVREKYRVNILLTDVEVTAIKKTDVLPPGFLKMKGKGAKWYSVQQPMTLTNVMVNCTCYDFYFRWAYWLKRDGALYGGMLKKYKRKTVDWPKVNPLGLAGCCKHTWRVLVELKQMEILKDVAVSKKPAKVVKAKKVATQKTQVVKPVKKATTKVVKKRKMLL